MTYETKNGVEGVDFMTCQVCGKTYLNLAAHLGSHGVSPEEYKKKHKLDFLISTKMRQKLSDGMRLTTEHEELYEPLSREEIGQKLREISETVSPLSRQELCSMGYRYLANQAQILYGSVDNALRALGLEYVEKNSWSKEKIIESLRRIHDAGGSLNYYGLKEADSALVGAIESYFGRLSKALEEAGLDPDEHLRCVHRDDEEWNEKFRQWSRKHGPLSFKSLVKTGHNNLAEKAISMYGSIVATAKALGLPYEEFRRPLTKDEVVARLEERLAKGQSIAFAAIHDKDNPLFNAMVRHWGGHRQCLEALGYDVNQLIAKKWPRERIVDALRGYAAEHGVINGLDIFRRKRELHKAVVNEFGSIKEAAIELGLEFAGRKPKG